MQPKPQHTPEPWYVFGSDAIYSGKAGEWFGNHRRVADCEWTPHDKRPAPPDAEDKANASRIVACVNACAGINPEAVPVMLKALRDLLFFCEEHNPTETMREVWEAARQAIAEATGEA